MKRFLFTYLFALFFVTSTSFAQNILESPGINAGFGFSNWGVPVYVGVDFPVHEDITVGGILSFQSTTERWGDYKWKHTIIGINARGDYHFNRLLELPEEWDLYAGLSLGFWIWNTKLKDEDGTVFNTTYTDENGGFGIGGRVGARYFFSENLGINLELGGGNVISGGKLGITYLLQ